MEGEGAAERARAAAAQGDSVVGQAQGHLGAIDALAIDHAVRQGQARRGLPGLGAGGLAAQGRLAAQPAGHGHGGFVGGHRQQLVEAGAGQFGMGLDRPGVRAVQSGAERGAGPVQGELGHVPAGIAVVVARREALDRTAGQGARGDGEVGVGLAARADACDLEAQRGLAGDGDGRRLGGVAGDQLGDVGVGEAALDPVGNRGGVALGQAHPGVARALAPRDAQAPRGDVEGAFSVVGRDEEVLHGLFAVVAAGHEAPHGHARIRARAPHAGVDRALAGELEVFDAGEGHRELLEGHLGRHDGQLEDRVRHHQPGLGLEHAADHAGHLEGHAGQPALGASDPGLVALQRHLAREVFDRHGHVLQRGLAAVELDRAGQADGVHLGRDGVAPGHGDVEVGAAGCQLVLGGVAEAVDEVGHAQALGLGLHRALKVLERVVDVGAEGVAVAQGLQVQIQVEPTNLPLAGHAGDLGDEGLARALVVVGDVPGVDHDVHRRQGLGVGIGRLGLGLELELVVTADHGRERGVVSVHADRARPAAEEAQHRVVHLDDGDANQHAALGAVGLVNLDVLESQAAPPGAAHPADRNRQPRGVGCHHGDLRAQLVVDQLARAEQRHEGDCHQPHDEREQDLDEPLEGREHQVQRRPRGGDCYGSLTR
ncbi:hypothetical protein D3C72_899020 [compost metagenome]